MCIFQRFKISNETKTQNGRQTNINHPKLSDTKVQITNFWEVMFCCLYTIESSMSGSFDIEQDRTEILFVKTCTYIHHHTRHLIQLYTRDIQL